MYQKLFPYTIILAHGFQNDFAVKFLVIVCGRENILYLLFRQGHEMDSRSVLETVLTEERTERSHVEGMNVGSIIVPLIKMNRYQLYLYGEPDDELESFVSYFHSLDVFPQAIICSSKTEDSLAEIFGVPLVAASELDTSSIDPEQVYLVVLNQYTKGIEGMELYRIVSSLDFRNIYFLRDIERKQILAISYKWTDCGRKRYYRSHKEELLSLYDLLFDQESKDTLTEFVRAYMVSGVYSLPMGKSMHKYFFGTHGEPLYKSAQHEVWLNCGANIGDTIFTYFSQTDNIDKVYAVEGDAQMFGKLTHNLSLLPRNIREKVEPVFQFISTDEKLPDFDQPITIVNADIEGNERELLDGLFPIMGGRPVLALCAYHLPDDLVILPRKLTSILTGYVYKLRKYTCDINNYGRLSELVLYAIPEERNV